MCEKIEIDKDLVSFANVFKKAGFSVYLVGGALRDRYLQRENYDIDVATDALPEEVSHLFKKIIPTGIEHGTVTIRFRGKSIECTTLRREEGYTDARHPDKIVYGSSIVEDLSRRDFTMNAMAASLPDGTLFDPFNGKADIEASLIRAVGNPLMRFSEDGLRPLRAIRFAGQLGFELESQTLNAICLSLEKVAKVSIERIQEEFNKILKAKCFDKALRLLRKTNVFSIFLPETASLKKKDFEILISQTSYIPKERFELRLTLLFCHIYKEEKSIEKIKNILKRLKYSNKILSYVSHLVTFSDFNISSINNAIKVRHFVKDVGKEYINDLMILKKAMLSGLSTQCFDESSYIQDFSGISFEELEKLENEIKIIIEEKHPLSLKDLNITGNDLLNNGFEKGVSLGIILKKLLDRVLEEPSKNTREELLKIANNLRK
ncbi:MAG: CCA tRNA nucleotidyltransferase [Treponema sp.]